MDRNKITRTKILDAAEAIFAEVGYHGASLRAVTSKARVNLAAVNYHFLDKQGLYHAVLTRRLEPINRVRLAELAAAEDAAGENPVGTSLILRIFFRPLFDLAASTASQDSSALRIIGRSLTDPIDFLPAVLATDLHPTTARFSQALRRHAPGLHPEEFLWRISFIIGALHHALATMHAMKNLTNGICRNNDYRGAEDRLVRAASAILQAPSGSVR